MVKISADLGKGWVGRKEERSVNTDEGESKTVDVRKWECMRCWWNRKETYLNGQRKAR